MFSKMRKIAHTDTKKLQFYSPKTLNLMLKTTILQQKPLEFALCIKSSTKYHHAADNHKKVLKCANLCTIWQHRCREMLSWSPTCLAPLNRVYSPINIMTSPIFNIYVCILNNIETCFYLTVFSSL